MALPNPYIPPDANDLLVYTLNESGSPWANTGSYGALNMTAKSGSPVAGTGLYANGLVLPGPHNTLTYIDSGAAGTSAAEIASNITVSCFVKMAWPTFGQGTMCVTKSSRPDASGWLSPYAALSLFVDTGGYPTMWISVAGTQHFLGTSGGYTITPSEWNHIGFTYDGAMLRLYSNGVLVAFTPQTGSIDYTSHGPWCIGGELSGNETVTGTIDDVRVANVVRPLSYFQAFGSYNIEAGRAAGPTQIRNTTRTFYGSDTSCVTDLSLIDLQIYDPTVLIGQRIARRLQTQRGSLAAIGDDPNFGLDVRQFINARVTPAFVTTTQAQIQAEVLKDEQVQDADVTVSLSLGVLTIGITGVASSGPFTLTLNVNQLTTDLIFGATQ